MSLYTIFENELKAAVDRNLERVEWPYPEALPVEKRAARLAEIETEVDALRTREAELLALVTANTVPTGARLERLNQLQAELANLRVLEEQLRTRVAEPMKRGGDVERYEAEDRQREIESELLANGNRQAEILALIEAGVLFD